ncbi:phosphonate ABC transporter, permease protein PhnE [Parasphingorhabdus sp.]|jgi:phosphonate transport system permease protein|uniref:phosphonate ABC transporter, permease protein PhnE n=1 Tax=Parasphingorhabdus sp. TaxID=2709688 RepID=UPI002B279B6C|nr:phosphonate ABC transporter, permease protein PhnE [Parasphingorhabdus sp.]|tara:strand:- start:2878 stop:3891 length:1014 start_codon:yes stop_codon:yes gene_type:complete
MTGQTAPAALRAWAFPQPFGVRSVLVVLAALAVLFYTGQRVEVDRMLSMTGNAVLASAGFSSDAESAKGLGRVLGQLVPLQISDRQEISRIAGFDPDHLPPFAYLEEVKANEQVLNPRTLALEDHPVSKTYLVQPLGYLAHVAAKTLETIEIGLWGTLLAVLLGLPLAMLGASNMMPYSAPRLAARSLVSFLRAIPELISALFLVVAFGFGPIAGFLALGFHGAGVLGRFFADEMEHADPRSQEALLAIGASRLAVWRLAILPQVMPHHIGSTLYVLDRNVRMATVIGLVGAGGIGQELKGRYDLYEFGHLGTILLAIFLVVLVLDQVSGRLRRRFL